VLLGLAAAILILPPLVVRGPVLRWIVARATRDLCGTIAVDGGHAGWLVVPDLLRGRSFAVELGGLRVVGPDGGEVMFVERITAEVQVGRAPWRIVVEPALVERGRWRLAVDQTGGLGGFLGVFRTVPAGEARVACLTPAPRRAGGARRAQPASASFVVRRARLEEIDVDLDFPVWGLSLPRARATGSLALGEPGGPLFTFEVRDARAPGGVLRAGPGGAAATIATTTAHFDDAVIARVGVSPDEPADLVLEVAHADTGRSRLSGKAVFENVFAHHGRGGLKNPPGLSLDARWDRLKDATARLEAPWLPREALGEILDGALSARVRGPFLALSGTLSLEGPRAGLEATVERGERAAVDVRASDLALQPFLHESLEPMLAGRLTGHLRAKLELAAGFRNADLEIPSADVTLVRDGPNREPPRIAFRVGTPARAPVSWSEADGTLVLGLSAARLAHRSLRVEGLSARWAELSARGALTLDLPGRDPAAPHAPEPPARIEGKVALSVTSLARWVSPATASARVAAEVTLAGPFDHLRARLAFAPSTTATILGERFRAPAPVTARIDGSRIVTLDGLAIERVGGGRLDARGRAERGGSIAGELRLSRYPLAALPGLAKVTLPPALTPDGPTTLRDALTGTVDAKVAVAGLLARPDYSGTLALTDVSLAGRRLGDGEFRARARGWTLTLSGNLGPALAIDLGATNRRDGVAGDANLKLTDFPLGPWLPPDLAGLEVAASGTARVALTPRRLPATRADVRLTSPAGELSLNGSAQGGVAEGTARGRLELAGLRPLWKRALAEADGAVTVEVAASPRAPLTGTLAVVRALTLRPAGWPLAVGVAEGGRVEVDGTRVHVPGVTLTAAGAAVALAGDVRVSPATPERSTLALTAKARLDAAALARQARLPALASASGTITVDARVTGEASAPEATGTARLDAVELRPRGAALPPVRVDGLVEASGRTISTRALRVEALGGPARGAVMLGAAGAPATVELDSLSPLEIARVDVPVAARGLRVGDAKSSFEVGALDLRLRLAGDPERELVLSGDIGVARARFDPFGPKKKSTGPPRPWFESLPPHLTLDLTLHGPSDAVTVDVPVLPDIDLGFRCRVRGSSRGGTISGELRGGGAYSRLMIALFGPDGVRECRVLKQ
jgi:hypothetical protein